MLPLRVDAARWRRLGAPWDVTVAPRALIALAAAAVVLLGGPVLAGPVVDRSTGFAVVAHSQLVSSQPGAGETVPTPPTEIRLAFSEPIDPRYTSLDLLDGTGRAILVGAGAPDPTDPHILVAAIPPGTAMPLGSLYTVDWRALSAADGHTTRRVPDLRGRQCLDRRSRGRGATAAPPCQPATSTAVTRAVPSRPRSRARSWPTAGRCWPSGWRSPGWCFALRSVGSARRRIRLRGRPPGPGPPGVSCCSSSGADSVPAAVASGAAPTILAFAVGTRIGLLLSARFAIGLAAGIVTLAIARLGGSRGPVIAVGLAGVAGSVGLVLTAAAGHASAFASPIPVAMDIVHLASASVWLGGLVMLGALTDFGGQSRLEPGTLGRIVPRFSALALVSVTLIALTGIYADWVQTRDLLAFDTPYGLNLLVKILVFVLALSVGLVNYLDGGRDRVRRFGLSRRLLLELILGVAVLAITANLTSGSPTGSDRPIAIARRRARWSRLSRHRWRSCPVTRGPTGSRRACRRR